MLWTPPSYHKGTIFDGLNNSLLEFSTNYQDRLPRIKDSATIFCFTDFSGEERQSAHSVYSFLIINANNLEEWDKRRKSLRASRLSDGRRISFKNYRDKLSEKFVHDYLKIVDELSGYLITISISKDLASLFESDSPINLQNPHFGKFSTWTNDTLEKTFRVMAFLSFFISGLSKEYQNLIWITDNGKIVANDDRLIQLTELFSYVISGFLNHTLGHITVGTTNCDDGSRLIEDLCSIPDLAAGAYSDQHKITSNFFKKEVNDFFCIYSPEYKKKTKDLTWWLSTSNKNFCKLFLKVTKGDNGKPVTSFFHFFNRK